MYLAPAAVLAGMVALWAMLPPVAAFQYLRMALPFKKRRPENIPGNLYVDESCMDCDACRWIAPDIFQRYGLKSVVRRQPSLPEQKKEAFAAMLACPNGAIRTTRGDPAAKDVLASAFPARLSLGPDLSQVFHAGFHSKIAGCTTPYLIARQVGCVMIDVPRYSDRLASNIVARCGEPTHLIITHFRASSDHQKWKNRFPGLQRIIHSGDMRMDTRRLEVVIDDYGPWMLDGSSGEGEAEMKVLFTPGPSFGSICVLYRPEGSREAALFSGSLIGYSRRLERLDGWSRTNVAGIERQANSMRSIAEVQFTWLLPARGPPVTFETDQERQNDIILAADAFLEKGKSFI